jgi:hypothetical protein
MVGIIVWPRMTVFYKRLRTSTRLVVSRAVPGALPDFLIIGAQKAGTTSLFAYLRQHPQVRSPAAKEVHFFDLRWDLGVGWYQSQFPTHLQLRIAARRSGRRVITGEASPYYFAHPLVPARAQSVVPDAKLIVILRDPVERAFAHYRHEVRAGHEPLTFDEALDAEAERIGPSLDRLARGLEPDGALQLWSYIYRGLYDEQLCRWQTCYPADQMLVLAFDDLVERADDFYVRVVRFLGLDVPATLPEFAIFNRGGPGVISAATRERLRAEFAASNEHVLEMTGIDLRR